MPGYDPLESLFSDAQRIVDTVKEVVRLRVEVAQLKAHIDQLQGIINANLPAKESADGN